MAQVTFWLNVWLNVWLKDVTLRRKRDGLLARLSVTNSYRKTVQASVWLSHAAQEICETAQDVVAVKRITCIRLEKFSRTPQGVVAVRHTP